MKPSTPNLDRWRYIIVLAKFMVHFLHPGLVKSLSVLVPSLVIQLDMEYSTAFIFVTLETVIYHLACPISHLLGKRFGCRLVSIIGGFLATISLLAGTFSRGASFLGCSFFFTGLFASPLRQTSCETLHQHFREHYGMATTITQLGSQLGSFLLPYLTVLCLDAYGPRGSLLFLSAMIFHCVPIGATMRPPRCQKDRIEINDSKQTDHVERELEPLRTGDAVKCCKFSGKEESASGLMDSKSDLHTENEEKRNVQHSNVNVVRKTLHDTVDFVKAERVFTFILLPCQALFDISYCGWVVFLFSYGISEDLSNDEAVFLVMMGSIGGITGRCFVIAILYRFPLASPQLLALNYLVASTSILAYPINSSPTYLSICSLFAGFGFYSASSTLYGAISVNVDKENFPKAIASSLLVSGISYLISGLITGFLYDVFGSYRVTFRILGILLAAISLPILIYICKSSERKKTTKDG
ncbi:monocarboxylate transporter 1-like [Lytechinus variegatus]|uniref:monocarboxylate transporter 1-like n=1 Tax=Lytechinus variegatus TaxID=7654 RepID=UPI001BB275BB|nr:monocarboxylate transporter 1-like [Lytechinus variegatus]